MSDAGRKILDGLRDAAAGNFARVHIEGQTWQRVDKDAEGQCQAVLIPRAQHEALMAAAETIRVIALGTHGKKPPFGTWSDWMAKQIAEECLAALRAAGILEGSKGDGG